jgi:type 1 glutamine amidotransferase
MAGVRIIEHLLGNTDGLSIEVAQADEPWSEGPSKIDRADGIVLFLTQGGQWMRSDPNRLASLERLAKRGGGISAIHWAIGAKDAGYIETSLQFIGACHGGPDRKYVKSDQRVKVASVDHPVARGLSDFDVHDEFYYRLKQTQLMPGVQPLLVTAIEGNDELAAWTWDRPDGGRSFGFVGLHFHRNWERDAYRRLIAQGILWTMGRPIPETGLDVECPTEVLQLPEKPRKKPTP